jgi:hypothetical protein
VRVEAITGLVKEQVDEVVVRVAGHLGTGEIARPGGRPAALGLYDSVVLVIHLLRRNPVQPFGVDQADSVKAGYAGMNVLDHAHALMADAVKCTPSFGLQCHLTSEPALRRPRCPSPSG